MTGEVNRMRRWLAIFALIAAASAQSACGSDDPPVTPGGVCGDGVLDEGEECDDGNNVDGDGCSATCEIEETGGGCADDCSLPGCATDPLCVDPVDECDLNNVDCSLAVCASQPECTIQVDDCDLDNIDCSLTACADEPECMTPVEECDLDNVDCDLAACADQPECMTPVEECDLDNVDCDLAACADQPECMTPVEECDLDNVDCDLAACADQPECAPVDGVCGDGIVDADEECDDGDDNSDTEADACRTDCTFATCGDGVVDEDEECDDGIDNARIPDACRLDCTLPTCGDGIVDSGEQCDDGDDNGPDGECSDVCEINVEVACADFGVPLNLNEDGTLSDGVYTITGSLVGASDNYTAPVDCIEEDGFVDGLDVTVAFTPEVSGQYRISTVNPSTSMDTVLYVIDDCRDGVPLACNDDANGTLQSSLLVDLEEGRPYFIVVDSIGTVGSFGLTVQLFDDETYGDVGDACSPTMPCADELTCLYGVDGNFCIVDTVPVLDSLETYYITPAVIRFVYEGYDVDENIQNILIHRVVFDSGEVFGAAPGEGPLELTTPPLVTYPGEGAFRIAVNINGLNGLGTGVVVEIESSVYDADGQESERLVSPVGSPDDVVLIPEGDECDHDDVATFATRCEDGFACLTVDGGPNVCAEPVAPTLTDIESEWIGPDRIRFTFFGEDPNLDVFGAFGLIDNEEGTFFEVFESRVNTTYEGIAYRATLDFGSPGLRSATDLFALVFDATDLDSPFLAYEIPAPVGAGAGEVCGTGGLCADGLVCSPRTDGTRTCIESMPPVLEHVRAEFTSSERDDLEIEVAGFDVNADVVEFVLTFFDAENVYGDLFLPATATIPVSSGRLTFNFSVGGLDLGAFEDDRPGISQSEFVAVFAIDADGNGSNTLISTLGPRVGEGAACGAGGNACASGLACGTDGTCEEALPPVLNSVEAFRTGDGTFELDFMATDPNADIVLGETLFVLASDGTVIVENPGYFGFDERNLGEVEFEGTASFSLGAGISEFEPISLTVRVLDSAGLVSNEITVEVPEVIGAGEACGVETSSVCTGGIPCIDGFCGGEDPICNGVRVIDFDEEAMDNEDGTFSIIYTPGPTSLSNPACDGNSNGPEVVVLLDMSEESGDFLVTVTTDAPGTTDADTFLYVRESDCNEGPILDCNDDTVGLTSTISFTHSDGDGPYFVYLDSFSTHGEAEALFLFTELVGVGEPCDEDGILSICVDSVCDEGICEVPPPPALGTCGDAEVLVYDDFFEDWFAEGDTRGMPLDQGVCGGAMSSTYVYEFTAPEAGEYVFTLTSIEPALFDTVLFIRDGVCDAAPGTSTACNDDIDWPDNTNSALVFAMEEDQTVFVFASAFGAAAGGTYELIVFLSE